MKKYTYVGNAYSGKFEETKDGGFYLGEEVDPILGSLIGTLQAAIYYLKEYNPEIGQRFKTQFLNIVRAMEEGKVSAQTDAACPQVERAENEGMPTR